MALQDKEFSTSINSGGGNSLENQLSANEERRKAGLALEKLQLDNENGANAKNGKGENEDGEEKLNAKEIAEVKAVAGLIALASSGSVPIQATEEVAKTNPQKYRKLRDFVKKGLPIALVITILLPILFLIIQAVPALALVAIVQGVFAGQTTDANGPPPLSTEDFYGVRIFYKNDDLSNKILLQNYNELAFEFLNSVQELKNGENKVIVKELKIELPNEILGADLTSYSTDFTNQMVYKIVESVLNNQNLLNKEEGSENPAPITVTQENLTKCLTEIDHFGLTFADYEKIKTNLTAFFVDKVETGINTVDNPEDDILVFNDGFTFNKENFASKANLLYELEVFKRFKISSEKVYVKDVLAGTDAGINVNGVITHYIYMSKKQTVLENRHYGIDIKDDSKYAVSFIQYYDGIDHKTNPEIADKTWVETGADIKNKQDVGDAEMFLKDDARYFNKQIELENTINCPAFTNIDTQNTNFLAKENLSVLMAYEQNESSAQICFDIITDQIHDGFLSIDFLPNVSVGLIFEDVTENGKGTSFVLADLE